MSEKLLKWESGGRIGFLSDRQIVLVLRLFHLIFSIFNSSFLIHRHIVLVLGLPRLHIGLLLLPVEPVVVLGQARPGITIESQK